MARCPAEYTVFGGALQPPSSQHGRSVRAGSPVLVKAPDVEAQNIVCQGNGARVEIWPVELKVINDKLRLIIN